MISPSLHPGAGRAACERRRPLGLRPHARARSACSRGLPVWLIPGFWDWRLSYAMPAWDGLVLLAALLDGLRLPAPRAS